MFSLAPSVLSSTFLLFLSQIGAAQNAPAFDPLIYIDQLIGSDNGGNTFNGATLPFGMAKAVADVDGQNTAGFSTDASNVTGFSHMHDSGTGGNPSMGNFPLFPQICPGDVVDNCEFPIALRKTNYVNSSVVASPGYFEIELVNGISAKMTTTDHAALYEITFPAELDGGSSPLIMLDLTDLSATRQNATIDVDAKTGRITANGTFISSFGGETYVPFICVDFAGSSVKDNGIWVNNRAGTEPKHLFVTRGINLYYIEAGGFVRFNKPANGTISARVGLSFISATKACQNAETEIPGSEWDIAPIRAAAEDAWREKLRVITVAPGGASTEIQTSFWSAVYRTMMSPQDYTGENPLWESTEPYYDSFYCLWDEFRSQLPYLSIIDPISVSRMVRSLLDTYKHIGWLPDCRMSLCKGFTQGGSNADVVITDAYLKNITQGIDWDLAWEAVLNDAENEPLDWSNEGRGGLQSWKAYNYIPYLDFDYIGFGTNSRSISRTLEYSYNDFCIAVLGEKLGKAGWEKYMTRANNWKNLYKADQKSSINGVDTGFKGFFQPKFINGTWGYQDPILCSPIDGFCSLTSNPSETFESSVWEYQFFVPQDFSTLIGLLDGPAEFIKRVDYAWAAGLLDIGNEPSFLISFLYHYAGRPALSSTRVHEFIPSAFNASTTGLPGNDDTGAMGSFTAFAMSGLFPNAGQDVYLIIPPFFKSVSYLNSLTNKTATVKSKNFDASYKDIFIQNATMNGKPWTKNWVGHEFFSQGWTLELVLGPTESEWGTKVANLPPSLGARTGAMMI